MMVAISLVWALMLLASLVSLVCFIMVLVKMFQRGDTTIGIVSLVLAICSGIGVLIAFVYGWINASRLEIRNVMIVWTIAIVASVLLTGAAMGIAMMQMPHEMQEMHRMGEPGRFEPAEPPEFRLRLPSLR